MRLFESRKISKLIEQSSVQKMNQHERLLKQFFASPEKSIIQLLQQISQQTGYDCEDYSSFDIITDSDTKTHIKNLGFKVDFNKPLGVLPKKGVIDHPVGKIEFDLWGKNLKMILQK